MKVTIGLVTFLNKVVPDVINKIAKLETVSIANNEQMPISGIVNYKLLKINKAITGEYETYEKFRKDLIIKLGQPLEDNPDAYKVPDDKVEEFNKTINELALKEVELNVPTLRLSDLRLDKLYLNPQELSILLDSKIVTDDLEDEKEEPNESPESE